MAIVTVRVKPNSRHPGIMLDERSIEVRVTVPAREGAANEAVRRALADALGLPISRIRLKQGAAARTKLFEIDGLERAEIERRIRGRMTRIQG